MIDSRNVIFQSGLVWALVFSGCGAASQEPTNPEPIPEPAPQPEPEAASTAGEPNDAGDEPEAVPPTPAAGSSVDEFMRVHAKDAELIRTAVIKGRPEETGKPADSLLHLLDDESLPKSWEEPVARMLASTRRVKDSSDVAGAAAAVADIGTSCGGCHQKLGGPPATLGQAPSDDGSLASRMKRHVWATERLWEGLYVPSDKAWAAGTAVLKEAPFPEEVLKKGGVYAKSAAAEFAKVSALAPKKHSAAERAAIYARLLGTCASCHVATR